MLDDKDLKLIQMLKENGRKSYMDLARQLNMAEATVRKRVKRLCESGVIRKFTIVTEARGLKALTLISTSPGITIPTVSEKISRIPGVENLYEITGQYDIAVIISASTIDELNECVDKVRAVEGVANTTTMMVLRSWI